MFLGFDINLGCYDRLLIFITAMQPMIGIRVSKETKKILQEEAIKEHRSLANFIKHAIFTYLQEHKDIDIKDFDGESD